MSLDDIEQVTLARAIAEAGHHVPLNGVRLLDIPGVCDLIRRLAASRDEWATQARIAAAELEREIYLRRCAEKDVANEKQRLATMTEYRDNGIRRLEWATKERDDAREALRQIGNCALKGCCKRCKETARRCSEDRTAKATSVEKGK